jgi:hypothetical protein
VSHGLFHQLKNDLNDLDDLYYRLTQKPLKNLGDGKTFPCYQVLLDDGLKVLEARYGTNVNEVDIAFIVSNHIVNDRVHVFVSNDLAGFDPDYLEPKTLKVKYSFLGQIREEEISEGTWLDLP